MSERQTTDQRAAAPPKRRPGSLAQRMAEQMRDRYVKLLGDRGG